MSAQVLLGPKGRPRNFAAMGDSKLRALHEAWETWDEGNIIRWTTYPKAGPPFNQSAQATPRPGSLLARCQALKLLNAEFDRRFNGIALPADVVELLAALAGRST